MEVRLLSVGARGIFSRRLATRLRGFAAQFCRSQREKIPLAPRVTRKRQKLKQDKEIICNELTSLILFINYKIFQLSLMREIEKTAANNVQMANNE